MIGVALGVMGTAALLSLAWIERINGRHREWMFAASFIAAVLTLLLAIEVSS